MQKHSLAGTVELLVRARIFELEERGGARAEDVRRASSLAPRLATEGDMLLAGAAAKSEGLLSEMCDAIAVLAFLPGGVTLFGVHFEAAARESVAADRV